MIDYQVDDGVAVIAWNMTERPVNVINDPSVALFADCLERALQDASVKGIVLTSKRKEFIAGGDLEMLARPQHTEDLHRRSTGLQRLVRRMETSGKPVVAAINGHAVGGGYELCLACHRRIAADTPRFRIGLPEARVGLMPGAGGTQRLPRLIGFQAALPLLLEGTELDQRRALKQGLIDAIVPAAELVDCAKRQIRAGEVASEQPWDKKGFRMPGGAVLSPRGAQFFSAGNAMLHEKTQGNYPAQLNIAAVVFEGCQVDIDTALIVETRYFVATATSVVARNMIRFFFTRRSADQLGTRPKVGPQRTFSKVGVIGAGMMGHGVAYVSAAAGMEVVLLDATRKQAKQGKALVEKIVNKRIQRGRLGDLDAAALLARIHPTDSYASLAGSELVIEAVFEERDLKARVTASAEAAVDDTTLFASNTSTLPITGLADASQRPESFVGLHFFSPVEKMPLVELIVGKQTSEQTVAHALDYIKAIGKSPIVVNDGRGFYTSRVFATYVREGLILLAEGVGAALVENAGRRAGMPLGPLALADEVAIELMHKINLQTKSDLGAAYQPTPADEVVRRMVEDFRRPGKAAGKGFYDYPQPGAKRLWPELSKHFPVSEAQPDAAQIERRLMYIQSLEAVRCLDEGVLSSPGDGDLGSILGWGFAPFLGGVFSQVDTVGASDFVAACEQMAQYHGDRFAPSERLKRMARADERFFPTRAR